MPRPALGLIATSTAGTPVLFNARNADWANFASRGELAATVNSFTLTGSAGNVSAVILASTQFGGAGVTGDAQLQEGTVVLVPTAPLAAGTYTVHATVTLKAGVTLTKDWTFTAQ